MWTPRQYSVPETGYRHIDSDNRNVSEQGSCRLEPLPASLAVYGKTAFITCTKLWVQDHRYREYKRAFAKTCRSGAEVFGIYSIS